MLTVHNIFVILNYISVFVMLGSFIIIARQTASRMQKLAMAVSFSLLICCIGFLFRIEADSVQGLILGQKLVYSFVTFGMFYMLLFILEYCEYKINKIVPIIFQSLNALITVVVLTLDHHKLFYKSYWLVEENGYISLEKEYGIFHTVAIALFVIYMAAALVITIIYSVHNIKRKSRYVWRLLVAVAFPCASYVIPKILDMQNDLQPMAFAAFAVMIIYMIYKYNLYDVNNITSKFAVQTLEEAVIVLDEKENLQGCNQIAKNIIPELKNLNLDDNLRGKSNILDNILSGKTEDIIVSDKIFDVTVSPVKNSENHLLGTVIRLRDETIEKKYTALLKSFSYKDDLTGCNNRRSYEDAVNGLRENGETKNVTIWAFDVNGLKSVNDTKGHVAGDELIRSAGKLLSDVFKDTGEVYRTGGDEFSVITQKAEIDNEKLLKAVEQACLEWKGVLIEKISLAVGYAEGKNYPEQNIDELTVIADKKMYENKHFYYESKSTGEKT